MSAKATMLKAMHFCNWVVDYLSPKTYQLRNVPENYSGTI